MIIEVHADMYIYGVQGYIYIYIYTVGGKSLVTFSFYKTVHRFCFYAGWYKYGTEQNETELNGKP